MRRKSAAADPGCRDPFDHYEAIQPCGAGAAIIAGAAAAAGACLDEVMLDSGPLKFAGSDDDQRPVRNGESSKTGARIDPDRTGSQRIALVLRQRFDARADKRGGLCDCRCRNLDYKRRTL